MKIAIFGTAGGIGKIAVKHALENMKKHAMVT